MRSSGSLLPLLAATCIFSSPLAARSAGAAPGGGTPVTLSGELEVLQVDDFATGLCRRVHRVRESQSGKSWELQFDGSVPPGLRSGSRVQVRGLARDGRITVRAAANGTGDLQVTTAAAEASTTGPQNTVVLLVNFTDTPLECTSETVKSILFSGERNVDGLYREVSQGKLSFHGDIFGPYTINFASTDGCQDHAWAQAAEAAAQADGVDLNLYTRRVYVVPGSSPCGWAGLGTIGGSPSKTWVATCDLPDVYAHEFGHNLGLGHSATDEDNNGINDCEYCDISCIMGFGGVGWRHFNAPHKAEMGWTPSSHIATPNFGGTYRLSALETTSSLAPSPQIVRVLKDADYDEHYYLSYRRPVGYNEPMDGFYADRTSIHTSRGMGNSFFIAALGDGETFKDSAAGVGIRQVAHDDQGSTIQISRNCTPQKPGLTATPSAAGAAAGSTVSYTIKLTNMDSSTCFGSGWNLSVSAPAGWTATISPQSLSLDPQQFANATLQVTSPAGTPNGTYQIWVNASDPQEAAHAASVAVTYGIGDTQAPTVPGNFSASANKGTVSLSWSASTDNVGVTGYQVFRNNVQIATRTTTTFSDAPGKGTWTYYVKAYDAAGNVSAASTSRSVTIR